jgi:Protein of unknown function (DUF3999)
MASPKRRRSLGPIECTFAHGAGTLAIFDRGAGAPRCAALALRVERDAYFTRVAIDAADDARHWCTIRDDALVYRVARDAAESPVTFTATSARYLRVRVLDGRAPFPLAGIVPLPSDAGRPPAVLLVYGNPSLSPVYDLAAQAEPVPGWAVASLFTGAVCWLAAFTLRLLRKGNPDGDGGEGGP